MNVVHFRISQISIPLLENQSENTSYFLSVHIGPTFIEFPLQLVDKKFLKSQTIISFNYDSADDYKFYLELLEKKPYSEQTELASIEIPIRICKRNRQSIGSLEMDIKDKSFLENVVETKNDDEYDDLSDGEYDSDDDDDGKSIKIFFEIHRSENKKKRFEAPLEDLRDFKAALLMSSRQSFDSSCNFTDSSKKKRRGAAKLTVSPQEEENQENKEETENEQKQQEKDEVEEEFQQITDEKEPENEEGENFLTEDENDQESTQLQQNKNQKEQKTTKELQVVEEEEEEADDEFHENINEEEEKSEKNEVENKDNSKIKSKTQSKEDDFFNDEENIPPKRKTFLSESESQNYDDDDDDDEGNENNDDHTTDEAAKYNILSDDDASIPPVELKSDLNNEEKDENEEHEEKQLPIFNLSSDSAQYAVYPPRKKSIDTMATKELDSSEVETNQQTEQENQQLSDNQEEPELSEQQKEPELNEQKEELESNEKQEEPESNEQKEEPESNEKNDEPQNEDQVQKEEEHQKEDQVQQQEEQNQQYEITLPPLSVDPQQQPLFYPQLNDLQDNLEPPVQQQPPILKFSSLDMQNFQCIDNFSFYPSPEQIGTYYIPPPFLPISIHPPQYD